MGFPQGVLPSGTGPIHWLLLTHGTLDTLGRVRRDRPAVAGSGVRALGGAGVVGRGVVEHQMGEKELGGTITDAVLHGKAPKMNLDSATHIAWLSGVNHSTA